MRHDRGDPDDAQPDIDGALVGGASIDADEFVGIVRYRKAAAEQPTG